MKEHKGMRPQDIVILLKILALGDEEWYNKDLAYQLGISNSEVSESLNRSMIGGLLKDNKRELYKDRLVEFLIYGAKYVFPVKTGRTVKGIPTAYSHPLLSDQFIVELPYVWPDKKGKMKGSTVTPLYKTVPKACREDEKLYLLLALADAMRVGRHGDEDPVEEYLVKTVYGIQK